VKSGLIEILLIDMEEQPAADLLTKPLNVASFVKQSTRLFWVGSHHCHLLSEEV
jgi:uncharacterized phosphosugar-binding protein